MTTLIKRVRGSWSSRRGEGEGIRWLREQAAYQGDDCVMWPYSRVRGYGVVCLNGETFYAHRFLCEMIHGAAPSPKHHASHSCGRGDQGCVNPRHISWKTPSENMRDKEIHGTTRPKGFPRYKLTPEQVAEIRATKGVTVISMAKRYKVSESCIRKARDGENWSHLPNSLLGD